MIKGIRIKAKQDKAVKITCEFKGSTESYALAWLHLTNNAREFPEIFLKHYNNSGNGVTVITPEKYVDKMKNYLRGLAQYKCENNELIPTLTIENFSEEKITTVTPVIDWGSDWKTTTDEEWEELDNAEVLPYEDAD